MGEAGRVRGLPGPEEQHLHPGLQWGREGHSVAPISRRGHTSSSLQRDSVPAGTLTAQV